MALVNSNDDLMAIKVLINDFVMPVNLLNHLCMTISFKLMGTKIVANEVEHFAAIIFSLHFSALLN